MNDFRRRQRMELERRVSSLDRPEEIFIPLERKIRVVASLQQELDAADGDRLLDLREQLVEAEHVPFRGPDRPIKRAEVALCDTDIRVVDVAIDDVGDDRLRMLAGAHFVGEPSEK